MKHRSIILSTILLAGLMPLLQAQGTLKTANDYLSFLTSEERATLASKGDIRSFGASLGDLSLWKRAPFSASVEAALGSKPSSIAAESLFLIDPPGNGVSLNLAVLRAFTSFTSMKGLQVYSSSLKRMETFIFDSWRIDSLKSRKALPDPIFEVAPRHFDCLMYQKEEQTGDIYSKLSYDEKDGRFQIELNNLTKLDYFFFTLVPPGDLTTLFIIEPTADKLIVYGVTVAQTPRFLGLERLKQDSFFYRMRALASWFSAGLAGR